MDEQNTWFDEEHYLKSKLAQLHETEPTAGWTMQTLRDAIANAGFSPFSHFQAYGLQERTSPNPSFNAHEYLEAKLRQLQKEEPGKYNSIDEVADAIRDAGLGLWDHFNQYGWKEGVNPSNNFDINGYFEKKLAELQKNDPTGNWDIDKVKQAFEDAGLDPVSHYAAYGKDEEGVEPVEVPEEDRVPDDPRPPVDPEPGPEPEPEPEPEPGPGPGPGPGPDVSFTVTINADVLTFENAGAAPTITLTVSGEPAIATFSLEGGGSDTADTGAFTSIEVPNGGTLISSLDNLLGLTINGDYALLDTDVNLGPLALADVATADDAAQAIVEGATNFESDNLVLNATYTISDAADAIADALIADPNSLDQAIEINATTAALDIDQALALEAVSAKAGATFEYTLVGGAVALATALVADADAFENASTITTDDVAAVDLTLEQAGALATANVTITAGFNVSDTAALIAAELTANGSAPGSVLGDAAAIKANGTVYDDNIDAIGTSTTLSIYGYEGDDTITLKNGNTASGGTGADRFIIAEAVGPSSLTTVEDYSFADGDIIDATQVTGLDLGTLEVRTATFNPDYDPTNTDDIVVQFAGGSGANLLLKGAGKREETVAFDVTDVPLAGQESGYTSLKVNVHAGGSITANGDGEVLVGGDGSQSLTGVAGNVLLMGQAGDDTITLKDGNTASGGTGADRFIIAEAVGPSSLTTVEDYSFADGDIIDATQVTGLDLGTLEVRTATFNPDYDPTNTDDIVVQFAGGSGANLLLKGAGKGGETIAFDVTNVPLAGQESGYTSMKVNVHAGGSIAASDEGEILVGGDGNQTLTGGSGNDLLLGGKGDDVLEGGAGADVLIGGTGADTFVFNSISNTSSESRNTVSGMDEIRDFNSAEDWIVLNISNLESFDGSDVGTISQNTVSDTGVVFGAPNDKILAINLNGDSYNPNSGDIRIKIGEAGSVIDRIKFNLTGTDGDNTLTGGSGNDIITGGAGADNLTGGLGADTFVFTTATDSVATSYDSITDFTSGIDFIKTGVTNGAAGLSQGELYTTVGTGNLAADIAAAIAAGGADTTVGQAYVVTITGAGAGAYVFLDADGDNAVGAEELVIALTGTSDIILTAGDFIA